MYHTEKHTPGLIDGHRRNSDRLSPPADVCAVRTRGEYVFSRRTPRQRSIALLLFVKRIVSVALAGSGVQWLRTEWRSEESEGTKRKSVTRVHFYT